MIFVPQQRVLRTKFQQAYKQTHSESLSYMLFRVQYFCAVHITVQQAAVSNLVEEFSSVYFSVGGWIIIAQNDRT
jgi:hypothetical protein